MEKKLVIDKKVIVPSFGEGALIVQKKRVLA